MLLVNENLYNWRTTVITFIYFYIFPKTSPTDFYIFWSFVFVDHLLLKNMFVCPSSNLPVCDSLRTAYVFVVSFVLSSSHQVASVKWPMSGVHFQFRDCTNCFYFCFCSNAFNYYFLVFQIRIFFFCLNFAGKLEHFWLTSWLILLLSLQKIPYQWT